MIIFKQSVIQYLDELVLVLYINEYFGYIESAELFVDKLTDYINENIITLIKLFRLEFLLE